MSTTYDQIQAGWSAHGRDGDKIGEIEEIGQNYLLVTKGLIFPKDLYIPMSNVQSVDSAATATPRQSLPARSLRMRSSP